MVFGRYGIIDEIAFQIPQMSGGVRPCFSVPNISNCSGGNIILNGHGVAFASHPLSNVTLIVAGKEAIHEADFELVYLHGLGLDEHS